VFFKKQAKTLSSFFWLIYAEWLRNFLLKNMAKTTIKYKKSK